MRIDDLQCNGFRLCQDPERFCFGIDAVLLANYARVKRGDRVVDLCSGNGIIPVLLAAKTKAADIKGIEIQTEAVTLARESIRINGIESLVSMIEGDIKDISSHLPKGSADVVTCNPPYMIEQHGIRNDMDHMTIARHEVLCNLEDVVSAASMLLKPGGNFYMVHRPFRLTEIMIMLSRYHLEPKRMRLVYPYVDKEPNMVLIEAKKDAKPRITVESPLIVYEKTGEYTEEVLRIYGRDTLENE